MSRTNRSILSNISERVRKLFRTNKRRNKDTIYAPSPRTLKTFYKTAEDTKKEIFSKGLSKLNEPVDGGKNKSRKQRKTKRNYKKQ